MAQRRAVRRGLLSLVRLSKARRGARCTATAYRLRLRILRLRILCASKHSLNICPDRKPAHSCRLQVAGPPPCRSE